MIETLEPLLKEHRFLKDLDEKHVHQLVSCAKNVRYDEGEFLCREGEEANVFFLIRSGRVALEIYVPERGATRIQTMDNGDVIGWSWLIPPFCWHFDAHAIEPTRAFVFDGKCLRGKCEADHDLGYELLKRFAHLIEEQLQATRLQLLDIYGVK